MTNCVDCKKIVDGKRTRCDACKQRKYRERKAQAKKSDIQAKNQTLDMFVSQRIKKYPDGIQALIYQFFERNGQNAVEDLLAIAESMAESLVSQKL